MTKAYDCALRLLCRREHGAAELVIKLEQKGYSPSESRDALAECQGLGLQSDARFAEILCRARIRQGYGPLKISQELQSKQIEADLIHQVLEQERDNWFDYALVVWQKKYKEQTPPPYIELQKRQRFLLYRGFSMDTISRVVKEIQYL